jgi:acyl-coenzyme A synthetase/AMP-(fatty) acid ligase
MEDFMIPIHDRISRHSVEIPYAPALIFSNQVINYIKLERIVCGILAWLEAEEVTNKSVVGLSVSDPLTFLLLSLALLRMGISQTPISPFGKDSERNEWCRVLGISVIVGENISNELPTLSVDVKMLPEFLRMGKDYDNGKKYIRPDNAFRFLGTGTTGEKKIIEMSHDNMMYRLMLYGTSNYVFDYKRTIILHNYSTQSYIQRYLGVLYNGGCLVEGPVKHGFSSEHCTRLFSIVDAYGVEQVHCTAFHAQLLADSCRDGQPLRLPHLKAMTVGASLVSQKLRRAITTRITPNLCINYGANESGPIARAWPEILLRYPDAVGVFTPFLQVAVLDSEMQKVAPGNLGIVHVKGPSVIEGYLDRSTGKKMKLHDGWFNTSDIGFVTRDGILHIEGRNDDMIIMAGHNTHPVEIERVMEKHPAVSEVAVVGVPSKTLQEIPLAFIVAKQKCSETELAKFAAERLSNRAPRGFIFVDRLPRNSAGKVIRRQLVDGLSKLPAK